MEAVKMYKLMLERYVASFDEYRKKASQLYADYSEKYHRFVTARDFHVRLAGGTHFVCGSPISDTERMMFYDQRRAAYNYVTYCLNNFHPGQIVGCLPSETCNMTIDRFKNEFLCEIHTDFGNFINMVERNDGFGRCVHLDFAEIFHSNESYKQAVIKMRRLVYAYYPLYARYPTIEKGYFASGGVIGTLEGDLVYSEPERLADVGRTLASALKMGRDMRDIVLQYFHGPFKRGISCLEAC